MMNGVKREVSDLDETQDESCINIFGEECKVDNIKEECVLVQSELLEEVTDLSFFYILVAKIEIWFL